MAIKKLTQRQKEIADIYIEEYLKDPSGAVRRTAERLKCHVNNVTVAKKKAAEYINSVLFATPQPAKQEYGDFISINWVLDQLKTIYDTETNNNTKVTILKSMVDLQEKYKDEAGNYLKKIERMTLSEIINEFLEIIKGYNAEVAKRIVEELNDKG